MKPLQQKIAPLSSSFMLTSIIGGIISAFYLYPQNKTWGIALMLLFTIIFVSSIISMTYAPVDFDHNRPRRKK